MKCHVCGLELPENAVFCGNCGAKVIPVAAEPVPAPVVEEVIPEAPVIEPAPVVEEPAVAEVFQEEPAPVAEPVMEPVAEPAVEEPVFEAAPAVEPVAEPAAAEPVYTAPVYAAAATAAAATATAAPQAQPIYEVRYQRPVLQLPAHRNMWIMLLLSIVTFGIYPLVVLSRMSEEINITASRYDGERTHNSLWGYILLGVSISFYFIAQIFTVLTLLPTLLPMVPPTEIFSILATVMTCIFIGAFLATAIYFFVWIHGLCRRMGTELKRRQTNYKFGSLYFWMWSVLWTIVTAVLFLVVACIYINTITYILSVQILIKIGMSILIPVGPCIFTHKFLKAMNLINADYNEKG